jgi:hypothetical protein
VPIETRQSPQQSHLRHHLSGGWAAVLKEPHQTPQSRHRSEQPFALVEAALLLEPHQSLQSRLQHPLLDGSTVLTPPPEELADNAHSLASIQQRHKGLEKWGIPHKSSSPSEVILLEQLVWVRYRQRYWWPAIIYKNYKEIAQQASQV